MPKKEKSKKLKEKEAAETTVKVTEKKESKMHDQVPNLADALRGGLADALRSGSLKYGDINVTEVGSKKKYRVRRK